MIGVDIGNTNLKIGKFNKTQLVKVHSLENKKITKKKIKEILSEFKKDQTIFICSVVPELNYLFSNLEKNIKIIGKDLEVPIKSNYNKNQVGSDRLLAAYAAKQQKPLPRLILDFGTAITLDFLSENGDYLGGIILAGINSTLTTFKNCALLPNQIKIKKTKKLIPTNTAESINKGLSQGFSLMINGLIQQYQQKLKLGKQDQVLVTGGDFSILKPHLTFNYRYQKHLVLQGLFHLSQKY